MTQDPVASEYARLAAQYDTRWSRYVSVTINETLSHLPSNPPLRILDVACGTGALLVPLLAKYSNASLTGIDLTSEMLEVARRKLPERVNLVCAKAEKLPFPAQYFDLVISANSFHYFRDPGRALSEFHRVLTMLGTLVITDWCDDFISCKVCDRFLRLFNSAHVRTYGRHECESLLENSSFEVEHVASYKVNWLWGMMTAQARRSAAT